MEIKIPFYNILNMLLTGLVFVGGCIFIFPDIVATVLSCDTVKNFAAGPEIMVVICTLAVVYEIGLIINRTGSVILEPFLKWAKLIPFDDNYILFNQKQKKYPIMSILSREYALSRTGVVLFLLLLILSAVTDKWSLAFICAIITGIYFVSCRKFAGKIVALIQNG